jgi:cytochrome c oxidase subunit II
MNNARKNLGGLLMFAAALVNSGLTHANSKAAVSSDQHQIIQISASRFTFQPSKIVLTKGEPVILEIESTDRVHGFSVPGLGIRTNATPGHKTRVTITPDEAGIFAFLCDVFCGSGHEEMAGEIVVQ